MSLRSRLKQWATRRRHPVKLAVVIVNHALQQDAIALKARFKQALAANPQARVLSIDSGSALTESEREDFDLCLPNVFYSGLFNATLDQTNDYANDCIVLFICSDVKISDVNALLRQMHAAFARWRVGIYAPSVAEPQGLRSTVHLNVGGLRQAMFAEGFCFAARLGILRRLGHIDTSVNALGWGIDVELGRIAAARMLSCYVDDDIIVSHAPGSGYDSGEAQRQWVAWVATRTRASRWYFEEVNSPEGMVQARVRRARTAALLFRA
jgi:hypothetical protein